MPSSYVYVSPSTNVSTSHSTSAFSTIFQDFIINYYHFNRFFDKNDAISLGDYQKIIHFIYLCLVVITLVSETSIYHLSLLLFTIINIITIINVIVIKLFCFVSIHSVFFFVSFRFVICCFYAVV